MILSKNNATQCILTVEDEGIGKGAVTSPSRTGIGRSIIEAMASKLSATVDYRTDGPGTQATLVFSAGPEPSPAP